MMRALLRLPRELGPLGIAALALIAAAAAFQALVVSPMAARSARLDEPLRRQAAPADRQGAPADRQGAPADAGPAGAAEKIAAVYAFLRKDEQTTDWLAKLHAIGTATGLQMKSATYRTQPTDGRIVRYEIVLPVTGSYPQIRDFLSRSSAEIPVLSVDQLTLKRETRRDGTLQAELRLTLHMVKS
jgi:hypothetical protein